MKRILIVDDQPHVTQVLQYCLKKEGYEVTTAPNGQVALDSIRDQVPDALITDVVMPLMGGEELCNKILQEFPHRNFPIIVMTSRTEREQRNWTRKMQQVDFLEKPISPRNLIEILHKYLSE